MFRFRKGYFAITVLLFFTEILIALYVNDSLIRPVGGDFLVVVLLFCLVRSFTSLGRRVTAFSVLLFSFLIEALQYFHFISLLGLENNSIARLVMGTHFSWYDIAVYISGILFVLIVE